MDCESVWLIASRLSLNVSREHFSFAFNPSRKTGLLRVVTIKPVIQKATNCCFIDKLRPGDHGSSPAISRKKYASDSVMHPGVFAGFVQHFQSYALFRCQVYFHGGQHAPLLRENQASSVKMGILTPYFFRK